MWEGLGRVCPLQKKKEKLFLSSTDPTRGHFLLACRGGDEVLIDTGIAGEEPLMLMRILFGCH